MIINPENQSAISVIVTSLAKSVAKRMGYDMTLLDTTSITDKSGKTHWMCLFDGDETRIYRVQNGSQRFAHIDLGGDGLLDVDDLEEQIKTAIAELDREVY